MTPKSLQPKDSSWFRLFVIDARALAVLRIACGLLVLGELFNGIGTFSFFYGQPFLTISLNQVFCPPSQGFWSLYWLFDAPWFVAGLMVLTGVSATCLALGFRTREMTAITLVLFWSLNVRNPLVPTAGQILLRMHLFWMLFLPVGAVWSLDAWRNKSSKISQSGMKIASMATLAITVQVAMMYFFSGIAKWNEVWMRGDALEIALNLDLYVKPFGHWLAQFPAVTRSLSWLTVIAELTGPLLLFLPFGNRWWRIFFLVAFCAMHVGIWLTMSIGIFSLVAIASWVIFLPHDFWDRFRAGESESTSESSNYALPIWASWVVGFFLLNSLLMHFANAGWLTTPRATVESIGNVSMTRQEFVMFGRPSPETIWFELRQGDGKNWETVRGPRRAAENIFDPDPHSVYLTENSQYWRRLLFHISVIKPRTDAERKWLLEVKQHLARCWLADARRGNSGPPLGYQVELNCWRRPIDLNAQQSATMEVWAKFNLKDE